VKKKSKELSSAIQNQQNKTSNENQSKNLCQMVYGIVAHDNLAERNNTTYAGKFLKNVIAYLCKQALRFLKNLRCGFSGISAR
jgi:hypothetical protein